MKNYCFLHQSSQYNFDLVPWGGHLHSSKSPTMGICMFKLAPPWDITEKKCLEGYKQA